MQQPKLIVLGLISQGYCYGFEMERFIDVSRMRQWARIGKSTIYKALKELLKSGEVTERRESAARGPGKVVFSLTDAGKLKLLELVQEALSSRESVYSDRIAGLVFAGSLPAEIAHGELNKCIAGLGNALEHIKAELDQKEESVTARIVINFYKKVYEAEREAMTELKEALK